MVLGAEAGVRALWALALFLSLTVSAQPRSEWPAVPITCDMVDPVLTARLLGVPVGKPEVEEIPFCAGLCPSLNPAPLCTFHFANPENSGRAIRLTVDLGLPPFSWGLAYSAGVTAEMLVLLYFHHLDVHDKEEGLHQ